MSSKIVDPEVTEEPVKEQVNESLEVLAVEDEVTEEEIQAQEQEEEHELPKKFQGKSATEIAEAYDNLEKELGRKGQEIGELRKLTDSYLQSQINQQGQTTTNPAEEVDFYDNPEQAVRKIIDNHPRFREFTEQNQKYKDADSYDFDSADELLTTWKERQMISKTQEVNADKKNKRTVAMKAGEGVSRASGESTAGKKIYRRADLIRLKQTDPSRYDNLADEI